MGVGRWEMNASIIEMRGGQGSVCHSLVRQF